MKALPLALGGCRGLLVLWLSGCAQPNADPAFTVSKIDSSSGAEGSVRVKLTTPGSVAEADADLLIAYVKIVAVREATDRQRQVAETRGRAAYRKIAAQPRKKSSRVRYLAVATEKSAPKEGQPAAAQSVMIWDTQSREIVGGNVYDIEAPPAVGMRAHFETYSAEYVGTGF